jgi:hypothetical protein
VASVVGAVALLAGSAGGVQAQAPDTGPVCAPGGGPVELAGSVTADDARTYQVHPVEVAPGTTRIEVAYHWSDDVTESGLPGNPVTGSMQTVVDAGVWDQAGYREAEGFRGWSGSRQGRVAAGQAPIVIQQDTATRGYRPAPIEPGTWWVELGFAVVAPGGASWEITVTCSDPQVGPAFTPSTLDPDRVVDENPGWYHADLHVHGYHSARNAPRWDDIVEQARAAGLEVLPVTEYVVGQHWDELGRVQDANPDVLLWPGREIITYHGHAIVVGETRSVLEYRHGFEDVTMADIQAATVDEGALFQVAHPTFFPGPLANFCRGCEYTLDGFTDWSEVTSLEVLTGPVLVATTDVGLPADPGARMVNPFLVTAIDLWEDLLQNGHRITAVSGSDSKANEAPEDRERIGIGSSATAIFASELSQPALEEGLRAGRAYVRTLGALRSPSLEVTLTAPDGATAGIGEDLAADEADLEVTVRGGQGDALVLTRNARPFGLPIPITSDPFTTTIPVERDTAGEGPLGTWVRVETVRAIDPATGDVAATSDAHHDGDHAEDDHDHATAGAAAIDAALDLPGFPTTIANPVFLTGAADPADGGPPGARPDDRPGGGGPPGDGDRPGPPADEPGRPTGSPGGAMTVAATPAGTALPVTGGPPAAVAVALMAMLGAALLRGGRTTP